MDNKKMENNKMENKVENKTEKSYLTPIIIIVVVILLIAGGLLYSKRVAKNENVGNVINETSENTSVSTSTVEKNTSLNNQTTSTPTGGTQNVSGLTYFIRELGVKFRTGGEVADLTYLISDSNPKVAEFSSKSLRAQGGVKCAASNAPLGSISLDQNDAKQESRTANPERYIQIGGKWVSFIPTQTNCSEDKEIQDLQNKQKAAFMNLFKGISAI